jgi:hypothetical protein
MLGLMHQSFHMYGPSIRYVYGEPRGRSARHKHEYGLRPARLSIPDWLASRQGLDNVWHDVDTAVSKSKVIYASKC